MTPSEFVPAADVTDADAAIADLVDVDTDDWRNTTFNACLEANGSEGAHIPHLILSSMRRNCPGAYTLQLNLDRMQMLKFFRQQAQDFRSLLPGGDISLQRGEACP